MNAEYRKHLIRNGAHIMKFNHYKAANENPINITNIAKEDNNTDLKESYLTQLMYQIRMISPYITM